MKHQEIVDHIEEIYRELSRLAGELEDEQRRRVKLRTWAEQKFRRINYKLQVVGQSAKKIGRHLGVAVYLSKPVKPQKRKK